MQPISIAPSVARLGANRKLAAQVNGFRQPPTPGARPQGSSLSAEDSKLLRHFLASLGGK